MEQLTQTSLQGLFQAIAAAQDEAALNQTVMADLGAYFGATRWKLMFLSQLPKINKNSPLAMRLALSIDHNPVLRYLVQRHAAVHDEVILPPGVWRSICPRADHSHVMVGPIVSDSQLLGGVAFTRHRRDPAFDADDLADLNAICLHISARLTKLRTAQNSSSLLAGDRQDLSLIKDQRITPRETEIATLVAQGRTNREIGKSLWITENSVKQALKRMFRKLEVSSRAEMVALLLRNKGMAE
ncbi:regulatory protein LuxR (plasmid) [Thalassoporum mexicanum PCC 7367]|uniref:helix-turn-helix transcriptional regulator n=1 Tax=Thalassoporum mexicanum TaxID=3457544 RepID=UPI00029FADE0|nr:LuxR C-terminal-related transcriptional regulator [Pseudanabaena sp. PCC 7367]AFY71908.1 regulatory protein LuxR [Pseudanabaena sp. PCC 7367]